MGDRVNIGFRQKSGDIVYLYQHWGGYKHQQRLAEALEAAEPRYQDPAYATRIVISRMIGDDWASTTGHGISFNELCDNEYNVHVVDFYKGTVSLHADNWKATRGIEEQPIWTVSIDDFVQSQFINQLTENSL